MTRLLDYLISGSDSQTLSKTWLAERMPEWDDYTSSQQQPGMAMIVSDAATTRERDQRIVADREQRLAKMQPPKKVLQFGRGRA